MTLAAPDTTDCQSKDYRVRVSISQHGVAHYTEKDWGDAAFSLPHLHGALVVHY